MMKPLSCGAPSIRAALVAAVVAFVASGVKANAAIGDAAPPIPSTYRTAHPRLPAPDSPYLTSLAQNATVLATYNNAAEAWTSTNPANTSQLRRLLIAYLANKTVDPIRAARYLTKIKALADLGGTWGPLLYGVNDGVGDGNYTVTSASANFLTGCGGSSCAGQILSINALTYRISSVKDGNTVVINTNNPAPSGSGLKVRIFSGIASRGHDIALIYDWLYNDFDAATRTEFMNELDVLCAKWASNYVAIGASPYNDVMYGSQGMGPYGLIAALAIYPDHPRGATHLRFMMDVWFNRLLPVWKQIFGPDGGGWHESWTDYVNSPAGFGLHTFLVPSLLSWQGATGDPIFARESWLKNFAHFTMYLTKPDFVPERIGDVTRPYLTSEYTIPTGAGLGSLNGLAEIYDDPVLRWWARVVNREASTGPDGFEPSAWPFYKPDNRNNLVMPRSTLPTVRDFSGWGVVTMRTGWSEDDTFVTLKYGDNFWSHPHLDTGAFTIFNRGNLAIDSGTYRADTQSKHEMQYVRQTVAHNTLTITDPADYFPTITFSHVDELGRSVQLPLSNDGGQRRIGSGYNQRYAPLVSLNTPGEWMQRWDHYHMGKMAAFSTTRTYTYAAIDITAAYNNQFSDTTPNASNRTRRVQQAIRNFLFIPRGKSAYIVVYDQVTSSNASFVKRWLLHTINRPNVNGNRFEVVRNELITSKPYPSIWPQRFMDILSYATATQYKYDGKLYGWVVQPQSPRIDLVGGPGREFWIEDPQKPGTGTNWNQCMPGQCATTTEGLGAIEGFINPDPTTAPHEPGSWRIELTPGQPATTDRFLNVMLATSTGNTSLPADVTVPANLAPGALGATWVDGGKRYTVTFPTDGVGGHIAIEGVVDEDLLAHGKPIPTRLDIVSGDGQTGSPNASLGQPLTLSVKDAGGRAIAGVPVHFAVSQGTAYLTTIGATTDGQGRATVVLTFGATTAGELVKVLAYTHGIAPVEFTAVSGGAAATPVLVSTSCAPASLGSGGTATCSVGLSLPAASGGALVTLASSTPSIAVPSSVMIPAGSYSATFTATAATVSVGASATVTATFSGASQTFSLTLVAPAAPSVSSLSCAPTSLSSGQAATCLVTLTAAAGQSGFVVSLGSSTASLGLPGTVNIAAGAGSGTFFATAGSVTNTQTATVTAASGGASVTASVNLMAPNGGVPITSGTWQMMKTYGGPVQTLGFEKLVYAPKPIGKAMMVVGYHTYGAEPQNAIIGYDFETNAWTVYDIGESFHSAHMPESGHPIGAFSYASNLQNLIYYCCASVASQPETPFWTWWYDLAGQVGRAKPTTPKPGKAHSQNSAFDPVRNRFVVHGGNSFLGTWTYDPSTGIYTQQTPTGDVPDPSVRWAAMTYNSRDGKSYLFGGMMNNKYFNDLYAYDLGTNKWTRLNPGGARPSPRWQAGFAYDSTNNVFLLFGGADATAVFQDTWIYDPVANTWTHLSPQQSPKLGAASQFELLTYDSDHNVFILVVPGAGGYADGSWNFYALQTWVFRYKGGGPNAGMSPFQAQPSAGGINMNVDAWAKNPSIAGAGSDLFAVWSESGKPFVTGPTQFFHIYGKVKKDSGPWTSLGGSLIDPEYPYGESHAPSVAVVGGKPWVSWYSLAHSQWKWGLYAKSWNGTAWVGGPVGRVGQDETRAYQGPNQLVDVGGVPYIAFVEVDRTYFPQRSFVYVKYWDGKQWMLRGSGPVNINKESNTLVSSISIGSDGTRPYVVWSEYTSDAQQLNQSISKVHVSYWDGSQWVLIGNALNVDQNAWAQHVSIAVLDNRPYVAWTENTVSGNSHLYVKAYMSGAWSLVGGGSLNRDTRTGWAFQPSLLADSTAKALYLGWVEQKVMGERAGIHVARLNGGNWVTLGASLNVDPALGSAQRISLAVVGGKPVAAWTEVRLGAFRQVYVKQWDGVTWSLLQGSSGPAPPACDLNTDGKVDGSDLQIAINQALKIVPCTNADLRTDGVCNVLDVHRVIAAALGRACVVGQ